MTFRRLRLGFGLVAFLAAASAAFAQTGGTNPNAPPPPPVPGPPVTTPAPAVTAAPAVTSPPVPSPSPLQRGRKSAPGAPKPTPSAEPTDTPEPPQFSTLDGIWEIEIQPIGQRLAKYEHFNVVQKGSSLTGYWEHDPHKTRTPITGTYDGRLIQIIAKDDAGNTTTFSGYVETFADMVGIKRTSDKDPGVAFTAQHRKKDRPT